MFHDVGSELAIANGLPQPIGTIESFLHHLSGHQNSLIATKTVVNASVYVPMTSSGSGSDCAWLVHLSGPCLCSPLNLRPKRDRKRVWSSMLRISNGQWMRVLNQWEWWGWGTFYKSGWSWITFRFKNVIQCDSCDGLHSTLFKLDLAFVSAGYDFPLRCKSLFISHDM